MTADMTPYILVALGLLLIFLEFCLPGVLLGVMGAVLVVMSLFIFFTQASAVWLFFLQAVATLTLVVVVVLGALRVIKGTAKQGSLYLESDQQGYIASDFDEALVGKKGVAMTDLRPAGHVLIDGKLLQAVSDSIYIEQGKPIRVLRGQGSQLVVDECEPER